jgi:ankyrin repeat protein
MRLIRTKESDTGNFEIKEFADNQITQYAILSHTWQDEEVSLQDIETGRSAKKKGYEKIKKCCSQAMADGFEYVWIDTCCIDKTSSAELSEAINSMYRWYQEADVCYTYLADVLLEAEFSKAKFCSSRWFTRGWTLQELIAPLTVIFFDSEWKELGTKASLQQFISDRTGIPSDILLGQDLEKASVAQRMSWAADRETTRIEDRAYCLLGIFGINMPLLYGEGERAFIRLQEEILRVSDDHSLFAWRSSDSNSGLLATTPAAFLDSGKIVQYIPSNASNTPLTISSKGIILELRVIGIGNRGLGFGILNCTEIGKEGRFIAIYLKDVFLTMENFERVHYERFELLRLRDFQPVQCPLRRICVLQRRLVQKVRKVKPLRTQQQKVAREELHLHTNSEQFHEILYDGKQVSKQTELEREADEGALLSCRGTKANVKVNDGLRSLLDLEADVDENVIKRLLARNDVEADRSDSAGRTVLSHAAGGGHEAIVRLLLGRSDIEADRRDSAGRTALSYAAGGGYEAIVGLLLARSDVAANSIDLKNQTPVLHAADSGHEDVVWLLLTRGDVDINQQDRAGLTLLSHAAMSGHISLLKTLLARRDFEPNQRDGQGRTPLSYAAENGDEAVVKLLIEQGSMLDPQDTHGQTPLLLAARKGHEVIVKLLIEQGVNLESHCSHGGTSLILAAQFGYGALVKLLIKHGANLESKNVFGLTPLSEAVRIGSEVIVKLLIEQGANLESKDGIGQTPLSKAAANGHEAIVKLLLDYGANLRSEDRWNKTPLKLAKEKGHTTIIKLLIDRDANLESKPSIIAG